MEGLVGTCPDDCCAIGALNRALEVDIVDVTCNLIACIGCKVVCAERAWEIGQGAVVIDQSVAYEAGVHLVADATDQYGWRGNDGGLSWGSVGGKGCESGCQERQGGKACEGFVWWP